MNCEISGDWMDKKPDKTKPNYQYPEEHWTPLGLSWTTVAFHQGSVDSKAIKSAMNKLRD